MNYDEYKDYQPAIRLGGSLAPSGSGTFPIARACDIVMKDNTRLDEYLENFSGGGGDTPPVDPTTVWELNAVPNYASLPISSNKINVNFISNDEEFIAIYGAATGVRQGIYYVKSGGSTVVTYNSVSGWTNANYKTVTFPDRIEDETLLAWLGENATLMSGSITPDEPESEDVTDSLEMPIIKFVNAQFNHLAQDGYIPKGYVSQDRPLRLSVEVIGGKLQAGDELQVCVRRTYHTVEYDADGNKYKRRKQKLRRFCWRPITEQHINERFLAVTIYGDQGKNEGACLYHNDRKSSDRLSALYLRIRRPVGELQRNESGMTVDAKFSNVVTIWKSYALDGKLSIK